MSEDHKRKCFSRDCPSLPARSTAAIACIFALLAVSAGCGGLAGGFSKDDEFERIVGAPVRTYLPAGQVVADLSREIPDLMRAATVPGLSIALVRGGEVVWTEGFGVKSTSSGDPVTSGTVFEACSLSKPVFAWAVMKMVGEGALDLDTPLYRYTGKEYIEREFLKEKAIDERIWEITARMVLAHMTGMPNWRNSGSISLSFDPGRGFAYSGEGYVLLQAVVEEIKGKRLELLMREYVFDPLGMDASSFVWRDEYHRTGAFPHTMTGAAMGMRIRRRGSAAASLYTTAEDFGRFMAAVLKADSTSPETSGEMLSSQCMLATETPGVLSWGLGFGLQNVGSEQSFWHWGDNGEYKCCMLTYRNLNTGVVYFTNSYNGLAIAEDIVNLSVGGQNPLFESELMENYGDADSPGLRVVRTALEESAAEAAGLILRLAEENGGRDATGEYVINGLGYRLMAQGRIEEAVLLFRLNVDLYPESFNVYDSLGEAYMNMGERELALENYERSVSIREDSRSGLWALRRLRFVPEDLAVPSRVETPDFRLEMLTGDMAGLEYEAVMASAVELREQFDMSFWPREGLTLEEEAGIVRRHEMESRNRYSFAWAVMDPAGERYLGSVYINPSFRREYDAEVTFWIRTSEKGSGLEDSLEIFLREWIAEVWPFERVVWPGRDISWKDWLRRG